jgi:hypothetical protein
MREIDRFLFFFLQTATSEERKDSCGLRTRCLRNSSRILAGQSKQSVINIYAAARETSHNETIKEQKT